MNTSIPDRYPIPPQLPLAQNFATNLNPIGPPSWVAHSMAEIMTDLLRYPPLWHDDEEAAIAEWLGAAPEDLVAVGGSMAALFALMRFATGEGPVAIVEPCFWAYREAARLSGRAVVDLTRDADQLTEPVSSHALIDFVEQTRPSALFICNPNNPTGTSFQSSVIEEICRRFPNLWVVVDQTYLPFSSDWRRRFIPCDSSAQRLVGVVSLSKFFCLPGLRFAGVAFSDRAAASEFRNALGPLRLAAPAIRVGPQLLSDREYEEATWRATQAAGPHLMRNLATDAPLLSPLPTAAPFQLYEIKHRTFDGASLAESLLLNHKMRVCAGDVYGLNQYIRIRPGLPLDNVNLSRAIGNILDGERQQ